MINDPAADLLDVYAFVSPTDQDKVVLALTVNPAQLPGLPNVGFAPDVLYQFKIDNDGDFKEDLVVQAVFTKPGADQTVTVIGPAKPASVGAVNTVLNVKSKNVPSETAPANDTVFNGSGRGGVTRVYAGLNDDPFFLDLIFVFRLTGVSPGGPVSRAPGRDFYNVNNISALVVEVPKSELVGKAGNNVIRVWGTTSRSRETKRAPLKANQESKTFVQIERTAIPANNTFLIPRGKKDEYNQTVPSDDVKRWRQTAIDSLLKLQTNVGQTPDAAYSAGVVDTVFLPDVLKLDVTSTAGFPNGRRFEDDVVDVALSVDSKGKVTSDAVNANDVPFRADFPFIAPPHSPEETIQPR